ncbi:uncharacterized protein G2W53_012092 [Senna tora]|uniref:Uncharacterized protein n=1 Tax=Senna tora TaxID=362788 RepID=A0A834WSH9_9FABA|nr:uncharacterized protein G2W53_012092 [Senna tora]
MGSSKDLKRVDYGYRSYGYTISFGRKDGKPNEVSKLFLLTLQFYQQINS